MRAFTRKELLEIFAQLDTRCTQAGKKLRITILGGASIVLLGFRDRATIDIDIAATSDAHQFQTWCRALHIPVDIVTICTTVDLLHCPTTPVFQGKYLQVHSVTAHDLIKLKLERFQKHDADDIYAILEQTRLSFAAFRAIAQEMMIDYLGNPRTLALSICLVTERIYPDHMATMEKLLLPK